MNWVLCHWVRAELHSSMPRAQRKPGIVKLALKRQQHKQNKTIFTKPKQSISRFISLAEQFRDPPMTPRSHPSHLPIKRKQTSPMSDPRFLEVLFKLTWKTKSGEISHVTRMKPTTVWRKTWKNKKKVQKSIGVNLQNHGSFYKTFFDWNHEVPISIKQQEPVPRQ